MKLLYDLGAHWGESIEFFRKKVNNPKEWDVISVEASPLNYEKLMENASYEANYFNEITIFNAFVYYKEEEIEFYEYTDDIHSAGSTFSKKKVEFNSKKKPEYKNLSHNIIRPEIFNIVESYQENFDKYDEIMIKMDIEGAEYEVLPHLIEVLDSTKTKNFYAEFHSQKIGLGKTADTELIDKMNELDIKLHLEEINYTLYAKTKQ